jgi:ubiquinone/menaquinone biosynthesis C-methylase UbiE
MLPIWQNSSKRSHIDVIINLLSPEGLKIIDIGCGAGKITRELTEMGAYVTGVDPGERQIKLARSAKLVGNERFLEGAAEKLPLDDESMDIALFCNSFHHVPRDNFDIAIEEARRVLKPGGKLYFSEPIADGPQFELSRLINDETEVRALAYEKIINIPQTGFQAISEVIYITENKYKNFDAFRANSTSINPAREVIFKNNLDAIKTAFEENAIQADSHYVFNNPVRANLFERL